jgi:hypothetical protein
MHTDIKRCNLPHILFVGALAALTLLTARLCRGQALSVSQEGSADSCGILGYRITSNSVHTINIVKCYATKVELLFSKTFTDDFVPPPVCFSNSAVTATIGGTLTKYTLSGEEAFSASVLPAGGICRKLGKWNSKTVYLVVGLYKGNPPKRSLNYRAYWFDIGGPRPVCLGERDVREAISTISDGDRLVLIGEAHIDRVKIP